MAEQATFGVGPVSSAIFRVARAHKALAARLLRGSGLRPGQELVLMTLWNQGPQRQVDLVRTLDSDAPTMVRSIARLVKAGLVVKEPSPVDGRATIVSASQASLELRGEVEAAWAELERVTVGALSEAQLADALDSLALLEANLAAEPDTGRASERRGTGESRVEALARVGSSSPQASTPLPWR